MRTRGLLFAGLGVVAGGLGCGSIVQVETDAAAPATLTVEVDPPLVFVHEGELATALITVTRSGGVDEGITLKAEGLPGGVTAEPVYIASDGAKATLALFADVDATQGLATVTVQASTELGGSAGADLELIVAGRPGSPDRTFAGDGTFNHAPATRLFGRGILAAPDGKILASGNTASEAAVIRLNPDGTFDDTWSEDGIATSGIGGSSNILSMALLSGGRLAGGGATNGNVNDFDFAIHAFLPDGSNDTDFSGDGVAFHNPAEDSFSELDVIAEAANGDLVVAGNQFVNPCCSTINVRGFRFSSGGVEDNTYSINEPGTSVSAGVLQPDGKLILVGVKSSNLWIKRFAANSSADSDFGSSGQVTENFGGSGGAGKGIHLYEDGSIVVVGLTGGAVFSARYDSSGTPDADHGPNGVVTTSLKLESLAINAATVDSQGRILFVGKGGPSNDLPTVVRLMPNGQPDYSFGEGGRSVIDFEVSGNNLRAGGFGVALDALGRILVVGQGGPDFGEQILVGRLWP